MSPPINVAPTVSGSSPIHEQPTIGLIGMGAMGKMYAKFLAEAGWKKINVCDLPEKYDQLQADYAGSANIHPMRDGHAVSRSSDFIIYSVEAEYIERVVAEYGPSTKMHAIVAGQTSVKAPEKLAFEAHLPQDVHIISCHSLHGPGVSPVGQVLIKHRASDDALTLVETILSPLKSRFVHLSYEEHDSVTANTQAVTHAAFLSMGTAWASAQSYPWEQGLYVGGIETVKVNLALRIYSNAWHVYAGLAILNPSARIQIDQYAQSASDLFKLMLQGGAGSAEAARKFRERIEWARESVFGDWDTKDLTTTSPSTPRKPKNTKGRRPILLSADLLDRFSMGTQVASSPLNTAAPCLPPKGTLSPPSKYRPNSHLSLLAMVDCWAHLGINPYHHLSVAATPLFRLFLGVAEHLFLSSSQLSSAMESALHDNWHRADDLEFVIAARGWSQCVSFGSFEVYRRRFDETRSFFVSRFDEAGKLGSEMIKAVMESELEREESAEHE
ncbi:prephenate dehydrogenase [Coprinopsis marcescibilis]|uniref:Prephenate dehydrogenase n=1 Tax=Coprinopsis marcescibilis TaxID=230819 RepID=A0A5C3KKX2_COPMA|nr:prephenate dehydrogenase [Coprinopsis marcescibilis]